MVKHRSQYSQLYKLPAVSSSGAQSSSFERETCRTFTCIAAATRLARRPRCTFGTCNPLTQFARLLGRCASTIYASAGIAAQLAEKNLLRYTLATIASLEFVRVSGILFGADNATVTGVFHVSCTSVRSDHVTSISFSLHTEQFSFWDRK